MGLMPAAAATGARMGAKIVTTNALDELEQLLAVILPLKRLREYGMKEEEISVFARNVLTTQQRLLKNNYVPLSEAHIAAVYQARW